jgi:hypothetical protein
LLQEAPADSADLTGFTVRFGKTLPRALYVMINKILLYSNRKNETYGEQCAHIALPTAPSEQQSNMH